MEPVTPKLPVIWANPINGNAFPEPPGILIEAVFEETVAVTPAPVKLINVALPCDDPSSAIVITAADGGAHDAEVASDAVKANELERD